MVLPAVGKAASCEYCQLANSSFPVSCLLWGTAVCGERVWMSLGLKCRSGLCFLHGAWCKRLCCWHRDRSG